jgi:hypothetical protein
MLDTINSLVLNEGRIVHMEHRLTLRNGDERLLLVYEAPYYSPQGRLRAWWATLSISPSASTSRSIR